MPPEPSLSVVVTVVSDTAGASDACLLQGTLEALERQIDAPPMEILVTVDNHLRGLEDVKQRFPNVCFIGTQNLRTEGGGAGREHHDKLRSIGIRRSRAPLVALCEDNGRPDARWASSLIREHSQPYAAIGGAMENGIDHALNWAVYFGDFGRYQNPVPRGPSPYASDANVCYKRQALEDVADSWSESYSEARVHCALAERGQKMALSPDVVVYQHRLNLRLFPALVERYVWGRSYAVGRTSGSPASRRVVLAAASPLIPFILLARQFQNVLRTKRNRAAFVRALPLTALLDLAWSCGEGVGYLRGRLAR